MPVISNFGVPTAGAADGTTLMPKLQYRFRVSFVDMGTNTGIKELTQNVVSASRPNMSHEEIVIDSYNSKTYLAGKHTWEPVTLVFRDDQNSHVLKAIAAQLNKQVDHGDQSSATAGNGYKFTVTIDTLDGGNGGNDTTVFDSWLLKGAFIQNVQYGDLNYATSDMVQVTLTLRYDTAENIIGGEDQLSAGDRATGTSVVAQG